MSDAPRKKTYNVPNDTHFLTFSTYGRRQLLVSDWSRDLVCRTLDEARTELDYDLWAYVVMPEHLHVLVHPRPRTYDVGQFNALLKRRASTAVRDRLIELGRHDWVDRLSVRVGGRTKFRFWQKGGGYDENLSRTPDIYATIQYIHENPVRRGLADRCEDWRWSSAAYWISRREGAAPTDDVPLIPDPLLLNAP